MLGPGHEKTQIAITGILGVATPVICAYTGADLETSLLLSICAVVGGGLSVIFTPDLIDVDGDTLPEARIRSLGILGDALAYAYDVISWMIPHRGISHVPVVGTLITLAPLSLAWVPLAIFGGPVVRLALLYIAGFKSVADLGHMGMDLLFDILNDIGAR
jgi:uncharacterized metal-binding protein